MRRASGDDRHPFDQLLAARPRIEEVKLGIA